MYGTTGTDEIAVSNYSEDIQYIIVEDDNVSLYFEVSHMHNAMNLSHAHGGGYGLPRDYARFFERATRYFNELADSQNGKMNLLESEGE